MRALIYIFIGGGFGSVLRFLISNFTQKLWNIKGFPIGTFSVNILGCFLVGVASAYFLKFDNPLKFLIIAGFCGGFTTFSTFSLESLTLYQQGNYGILALYVVLSIVFGLLGVYAGFMIMEKLK